MNKWVNCVELAGGTGIEPLRFLKILHPREAGMNSSGLWIGELFRAIVLRGSLRRAVSSGLIVGAALLFCAGIAHSGPCTAQIAAIEQQIKATTPGPESGATFPQTLGAQLHKQPTPLDVEHAERVANKDGEAALDAARKADAEGDAAVCNANLVRAKHLYDIDQ
jgi:hypothetical protein